MSRSFSNYFSIPRWNGFRNIEEHLQQSNRSGLVPVLGFDPLNLCRLLLADLSALDGDAVLPRPFND